MNKSRCSIPKPKKIHPYYDRMIDLYKKLVKKLFEQIKELEDENTKLKETLRIFTRPANYESSGIKPPCCDAMVRVATKVLG